MAESNGKFPLIYFNAPDPSYENYTTNFIETSWEPYVESLRTDEYTMVHAFSNSGLQFTAVYST
jgi:hypothetical protein